MANEKRLIDANAFQFEPDKDNCMNGVLFMGRATGKTLQLVRNCLQAMIYNAPTVDAVEVVRCKDCRRSGVYTSGKLYKHQDGLTDPKRDDFCSYGERREGE